MKSFLALLLASVQQLDQIFATGTVYAHCLSPWSKEVSYIMWQVRNT